TPTRGFRNNQFGKPAPTLRSNGTDPESDVPSADTCRCSTSSGAHCVVAAATFRRRSILSTGAQGRPSVRAPRLVAGQRQHPLALLVVVDRLQPHAGRVQGKLNRQDQPLTALQGLRHL